MTNPMQQSTPEQTAFNRGYFDGYAAGQQNVRATTKKRWPTWARIAVHGVAYLAVFGIGMSVGGGARDGVQQGYNGAVSTAQVPTAHSTPTTTQPASTAGSAAAGDAKQAALGRLFTQTQQRGSLAHLTEEQLKTAMDTFVCKHLDDIMALGQGGAGISGSDAGYLFGANSVIGYC